MFRVVIKKWLRQYHHNSRFVPICSTKADYFSFYDTQPIISIPFKIACSFMGSKW